LHCSWWCRLREHCIPYLPHNPFQFLLQIMINPYPRIKHRGLRPPLTPQPTAYLE
jgi:hypothetical protein